MMQLYGVLQALTGNEIVTVLQEQNGQWVMCSVPVSQLSSGTGISANNLPTTKPSGTGILWNNSGVVSVS